MDWTLAIKRNREALSRILAALFALAGLEESGPAGHARTATLPRHLRTQAMRILRAAESAIRRLIVIAAPEVMVQPAGIRPDFAALGKAGPSSATRIPAFPLLDPLKRYPFDQPRRASKFFPRISVAGITEPAPIPEKPVLSPDDPVNATALCRRLLSSRRALANLRREACRLARLQARNRLRRGQSQGRGRVSPLRIGYPPGRRKRPTHLVDDILKECQALALDALDPPDTS